MSKMTDILFKCWKLEPPKLLISGLSFFFKRVFGFLDKMLNFDWTKIVTGGAQNFQLKPSLKEQFRKGLVKAALSTQAWISTGGSNAGVMKHVGEAIKDSPLKPDENLVVLGIANWCTVADNHLLINNNVWDDF